MAELGSRERALLEEAASWRLIGLAFERPRGDWAETIRSVSGERRVDTKVSDLAGRAVVEGSEEGFLAAFGPGGSVSPREVSYRHMGDPGRILAELKLMYDAFCYVPRTEEPPDHVSVEAGFVGFLRLKEAYSLMMGDEETASITRGAAALFIREHLMYLATGIDRGTVEGYLRVAVGVLVERLGPIPDEIVGSVAASNRAEDLDDIPGCAFGGDAG